MNRDLEGLRTVDVKGQERGRVLVVNSPTGVSDVTLLHYTVEIRVKVQNIGSMLVSFLLIYIACRPGVDGMSTYIHKTF
jgi:hypothetical protein